MFFPKVFGAFLILIWSLAFRVLAQWTSAEPFPTTITSNRNLTSLSALLSNYSDIFDALTWSQGFTFLAPSNDAFDKIPYTDLKDAFSNNDSDQIHAIIQYHVLEGIHRARDLTSQFVFLPTWLQNTYYSNVTGGQRLGAVEQSQNVYVLTSGLGSRSTIIQSDIQASNSIIQVIDSFLVPPENFTYTAPSFNLTSADGAFAASNLNTTLLTSPDLTVFAPSNEAMRLVGLTLQSLTPGDLAQVMSYHVVNSTGSGGSGPVYSSTLQNGSKILTMQGSTINVEWSDNTWFLNSAKITQPDLLFSGGVLHVIDSVLSPNATSVTPNLGLGTDPPAIAESSASDVPYVSLDPPTSYVSPPPSASNSATTSTAMGPSTTSDAATTSTKISNGRPRTNSQSLSVEMQISCLAIFLGIF
ncbi:MAG: hypothetical protein Q9157_000635 [Trypethelium eluteriae]